MKAKKIASYPPCGLCCRRPGKVDEVVAMIRCESVADIADNDAGVTLTQHFLNPSFGTVNDGQEAVYKFPLVGDVAVYHFKSQYLAENGDVLKTLIGKAKEKQQAREEYEQAKANGKAAQLLEQDYENSPNFFVMSLGNIPRDCKTVVVELAFYCPLQTEEKGVVKRFTLPAVITGRYGKYTAGAFKGPNVKSFGALFDFEANIALGDYISSLESPTHNVTSKLMIDGSPSKAKISFSKDAEPLSKDLVLKISSGAEPKSSILLQDPEAIIANEGFSTDFPDTTLAKLTFNCNIEADEDAEIKKNFIFVVDRSGSMSGASMRNCKKALELCLASLPEECCFDICSFGSRFDFLFKGKSRDYSEETLEIARKHVESMFANYGGTEILKPLQKIVAAKSDVPTVIFLLTDGQVYNTAAIVSLIKKEHEKSGTTVFTCGIGSGVDRHLVDGLAKAGGGTATYIAYGEKMNAKLAAQMEQAIEPPCTNLKVELGDLKLSQSKLGWNPSALLPPFVYSGQRVDCYLALDSNSVLEVQKKLDGGDLAPIQLRGKMKIEDKEQTLTVAEIDMKSALVMTNSNLIVPAFRQQITLVEEATKAKKSEKKKAVNFAVAANIVTKYTSLVAVEEGNETNEKAATTESTPVRNVYKMEERSRSRGGGAMMKKRKVKKSAMSFSKSLAAPARSAPPPPGGMLGFNSFGAASPSFASQESAAPPPAPMMMRRMASEEDDDSAGSFGDNLDTFVDNEVLAIPEKKKASRSSALKAPKGKVKNFNKGPAPAMASDDDKLRAIIGLQATNGSFAMSDALKAVIGKKSFNGDEKLEGFATALVVKFFELKLAGLKAEWKLMHKKAKKWLKKNVSNHEELLVTAAKYI